MTRLHDYAITPIKISDAPVGRLGRHGRLLLRLSAAFSLALRSTIALTEGTRGVETTKRFSRHVVRTSISRIPIKHCRPEIERATENNTSGHAKRRNVKSSRTLYGAGRGRASCLLTSSLGRRHELRCTHGECRAELRRICTNLHDRPRLNCSGRYPKKFLFRLLFHLCKTHFFTIYVPFFNSKSTITSNS